MHHRVYPFSLRVAQALVNCLIDTSVGRVARGVRVFTKLDFQYRASNALPSKH